MPPSVVFRSFLHRLAPAQALKVPVRFECSFVPYLEWRNQRKTSWVKGCCAACIRSFISAPSEPVRFDRNKFPDHWNRIPSEAFWAFGEVWTETVFSRRSVVPEHQL